MNLDPAWSLSWRSPPPGRTTPLQVSVEMLKWSAQRIFSREFSQKEASMAGLGQAVPLFITGAPLMGVHQMDSEKSMDFFHQDGSTWAAAKLAHFSFFSSEGNDSLRFGRCFSRLEHFLNWGAKDFKCFPDEPGFISPIYQGDFLLPTPPGEGTYREFVDASWIPRVLDERSVKTAQDDYVQLVKALKRRMIVPIFWVYSEESAMLLLSFFGIQVQGSEEGVFPDVKMGLDFIVHVFKAPTLDEMTKLEFRRAYEVLNRGVPKAYLEEAKEVVNEILTATTERALTVWAVRDGKVRVAKAISPTMSERFLIFGPWFMNLCTRGRLDFEQPSSLLIDRFLMAIPDDFLRIPIFPEEVRLSEFPLEVCHLERKCKGFLKSSLRWLINRTGVSKLQWN